MKRIILSLIFVVLLVSACSSKPPEVVGESMVVTDGTTEKSYTIENLRALGDTQALFNEVSYVGVSLAVLLEDAGFDPASLSAVKATAADGFSANYAPALFMAENTLVSYARADGPLAEDEAPFRMVLPNQGGKLNPRQLVEITAIP